MSEIARTALREYVDRPPDRSGHAAPARNRPAGCNSGNSRNGRRAKTVLAEIDPVEIEVPRDTSSTFEPQIVRKRQRVTRALDPHRPRQSALGDEMEARLNAFALSRSASTASSYGVWHRRNVAASQCIITRKRAELSCRLYDPDMAPSPVPGS